MPSLLGFALIVFTLSPVMVLTQPDFDRVAAPIRGSLTRMSAGDSGDIFYVDFPDRIVHLSRHGTVISAVAAPKGTRIDAIVTGPKNSLWYADAKQRIVGLLSANGRRQEQWELGFTPIDLTVDRWGSAWVLSGVGDAIYRVSSSGKIKRFSLPQAESPKQGGFSGRLARMRDGRVLILSQSHKVIWIFGRNPAMTRLRVPNGLDSSDLSIFEASDRSLWLVSAQVPGGNTVIARIPENSGDWEKFVFPEIESPLLVDTLIQDSPVLVGHHNSQVVEVTSQSTSYIYISFDSRATLISAV